MLDNNKEVVITADGLLSICLQHEIDHLSGIVFYQRIDKKHVEFRNIIYVGDGLTDVPAMTLVKEK